MSECIESQIKDKRSKIISNHFKYNKLGFVVDSIYTLSNHNINYARSILDRIESGESKESLLNELALEQHTNELQLVKEKELLEKEL